MSVRLADVCVAAIADCFRGDGEIVANPIGTIPMIGGPSGAGHVRAGPDDDRRRGVPRRRRSRLLRPERRTGHRAPQPVSLDVRHRVVGAAPRDHGRQPDRSVRQPELRGDRRRLPQAQGAAARLPWCARQHGEPHDVVLDPEPFDERVRAEGRCRVRCRLRPRREARQVGAGLRAPSGDHEPVRDRLRIARAPDAPAVVASRRVARRGRRRDRLRARDPRRRSARRACRPTTSCASSKT